MSYTLCLQKSIDEWLEYHELGQYSELFKREGYEDLSHMKDLKADQLKNMGIKKRGTLCIHILIIIYRHQNHSSHLLHFVTWYWSVLAWCMLASSQLTCI
jgi:hypothetical protein